MTDKAEEKTEGEIVAEQHREEGGGPIAQQSTNVDATPPATGPAFILSAKRDDEVISLANLRMESVRVNGEPCDPKDLNNRKLKSKDDGSVVITATGVPTYGGEQMMRGAIAGREATDLSLEFVDGPKVSGSFRVNRMDHCGGGTDREYIVVLENAAQSED
jgi:hypothetical protein